MHVSADTNRVKLMRRYDLGERAGQIRGDCWQGTTWHEGRGDQAGRAGPKLDKLAAQHGFNREQLLECHRLYRAWPRRRFEWLVSQKRPDGTALFVLSMLIDLQPAKVDQALRRRLEEQQIQKQMDSVTFTARVRQAITGAPPVQRKVEKPSREFESFQRNADKLLPHFPRIRNGIDLLTEPGQRLTARERSNAARGLELVRSRLGELRSRVDEAMRAVDRQLQSAKGRVRQF